MVVLLGGNVNFGVAPAAWGSYLLRSTLCLFMQTPTLTCLHLLYPGLPGQGLCRGVQNEELARSSLPLGHPGSQHSSSLLLIPPHRVLWPLKGWSTPSKSCTQGSKGSALIPTGQEHEAMREWIQKLGCLLLPSCVTPKQVPSLLRASVFSSSKWEQWELPGWSSG